ncbi:hypothetical protein DY000_02031546 [Brassica cretica]|uniref:Uncharacterized protein n=1 Tax=Brassica cretica TaxID=69181 RepID=A0ABQ7DLG0_BRACR|nr:hypothetical protein DY000_02031546 [Brassica cretica]
MANRYDPNPFAEEEEVNPFANDGSVPAASNSRLSPLPPDPVGFDYGRTVDIPLGNDRSGTQLKAKPFTSSVTAQGGASQSMGQRIKRFDFVSRDTPHVGFESRGIGDYPARCILLHFPKRTFIHFFLPRRPRRLKRREKTRPGKEKGRWWTTFGKAGPIGCLRDDTEEERNEVRGRGARKRVESIRLDDRKKQNEIRGWPKKKQRYGYHDRSPSIKKNLSKSLRISGAFKHPKYAGVVNDIAFLIENDDSLKVWGKGSSALTLSPGIHHRLGLRAV